MPEQIDLVALWNEVNAGLRRGPNVNRSLWDAAAAAKPLLVEDDTLVLGLPPAQMRLASYLTVPQNKQQILQLVESSVGRRLDLQVIEGVTPEAWRRFRERQQVTEDRVAAQADFRTAHKGALGVWEELPPKLHQLYTEIGVRRFAEPMARLLIRSLPLVAEAEEKARAAEPEAEQLHSTHLNRIFDKLATYCDISPTMVALEYLRYRSSRRRQQG